MELVFFWFLFAVFIGIGASSRGRSGFGWFLLAVIISPLLALILLALMPSLAKPQSAVTNETPAEDLRKCPECAEPIKREARKCKHCGSTVEPLALTSAEAAPSTGAAGYEVGKSVGTFFGGSKKTDKKSQWDY